MLSASIWDKVCFIFILFFISALVYANLREFMRICPRLCKSAQDYANFVFGQKMQMVIKNYHAKSTTCSLKIDRVMPNLVFGGHFFWQPCLYQVPKLSYGRLLYGTHVPTDCQWVSQSGSEWGIELLSQLKTLLCMDKAVYARFFHRSRGRRLPRWSPSDAPRRHLGFSMTSRCC